MTGAAALRLIGERLQERHRLTHAHLDALGRAYYHGLVDVDVASVQLVLLEEELRWLGDAAELLVGLFQEDELERLLAKLDLTSEGGR